MPRVVETTVFQYAELNEQAQERAREWFKTTEGETWGSDRAPDYYEDMAKCLSFLGIDVAKRTETWTRVHKDKPPTNHSKETYDFQWSGFWSQGDGLVYSGDWDATRVDLVGLKEYAPQDAVLDALAKDLMAFMLRWPTCTCKIGLVNSGPDLPYMSLDEVFTGGLDADGAPGWPGEADTKVLKRLLERAATWCYRQLESNYEYDCGDEAAVEGIEANEYEFNEEGERV